MEYLGEEERVVRVACRVLLWLEQRIKVPERGLHIVVGGHFGEAHLGEDLAELRAHLRAHMSACVRGVFVCARTCVVRVRVRVRVSLCEILCVCACASACACSRVSVRARMCMVQLCMLAALCAST